MNNRKHHYTDDMSNSEIIRAAIVKAAILFFEGLGRRAENNTVSIFEMVAIMSFGGLVYMIGSKIINFILMILSA